MNIYKRRNGLTLVELIISLGIIGILLTLIYSVNLFGMRTFSMGDKQSAIQNDISQASAFITEEIRFATELSLTTKPVTFDPLFHYIYIQDSYVKYTHNNVTMNITNDIITELSPMFKLEKMYNGKNMLLFELKSNISGHTYSIKTEVLLHNKSGLIQDMNQAIKYKKPV